MAYSRYFLSFFIRDQEAPSNPPLLKMDSPSEYEHVELDTFEIPACFSEKAKKLYRDIRNTGFYKSYNKEHSDYVRMLRLRHQSNHPGTSNVTGVQMEFHKAEYSIEIDTQGNIRYQITFTPRKISLSNKDTTPPLANIKKSSFTHFIDIDKISDPDVRNFHYEKIEVLLKESNQEMTRENTLRI